MTEERDALITKRAREIVTEECEKYEITEWSSFVILAAQMLFDARNQAFDIAAYEDTKERPDKLTRNRVSKTVFNVLQRWMTDLEIEALQDVE